MITAAEERFRPDLDPACTIPDLQRIIEDAIVNDPRSLQRRIGPSSLGMPCDRCLALELSGILEPSTDAAWLPAQGRAVHAFLQDIVDTYQATTGTQRYITEGKVSVGTVGGIVIDGHSDLLDTWTGCVVDYKDLGITSIRKYRKQMSVTYRHQLHLYGKGWYDAGFVVKSVALWALPRNGFHIGDGFVFQEAFNRPMAVDVINHADMLAQAITALGLEAVLARLGEHTGTEFSCPDPKAADKAAKQLDGLIMPSTTRKATTK